MFECVKCGGKTKTVQTVHGREDGYTIIQRRCKCLECNAMFITKETFERFTEHCIKQHVKKQNSKSNLEAFVDRLNATAVVSRGNDKMVQLVAKSEPMSMEDWNKLSEMFKDVDTSDVGIIRPGGERHG